MGLIIAIFLGGMIGFFTGHIIPFVPCSFFDLFSVTEPVCEFLKHGPVTVPIGVIVGGVFGLWYALHPHKGVMKIYRQLFCGIFVYLILLLSFYALETRAERAWIKTNISHLKSFDPSTAELKHCVACEFDEETLEYGPDKIVPFEMYTANGHMYVFKDGNWAYVVIHTFHDDDYLDAPRLWGFQSNCNNIGDVALAVDSSGTIYSTRDHICAGIPPRFHADGQLIQACDIEELFSWSGAQWIIINKP